ncbi:MAG: glycosyl hydrolase-related protein [bacterium]|nr:glycosyl hydrolase-related protein [bacterium]
MKIYIVPHFHYDAAWLKTREEYLQICHRHILEVLKLLREYPDYCFLLEQAYLIKTFLQRYPEQAPFLKEFVKKGRIELTGMYVCPDVNIPSGEGLIRQIKMGKEFFEKEFGVEVKTGYLVDVFGSHPQMPQIMAKSGMISYIFGRGMTGKKMVSEFMWEGLDGTKILGIWLPLTGCNLWPVPGNYHEFSSMVEKVTKQLTKFSQTGLLLLMSGYDFSAPSRDLPLLVQEWNKRNMDKQLRFITLQEYTNMVYQIQQKLPVISQDFNPVFQGCYSSRIGLKLKNRELENGLYQLEALNSMVAIKFGTAQNIPEIAWEKVIFNQFHDIICGSHVDEVYEEAMQDYKCAEEILKECKTQTLQNFAQKLMSEEVLADQKQPAFTVEEIGVLVINTLAWKRTGFVEIDISFSQNNVFEFSVVDHQGKPVVYQEVCTERFADGSLKMVRIAFIAEDMPGLGYRIYRICLNKSSSPSSRIIGQRIPCESLVWSRGTYDGLGLVEMVSAENEFFSCCFDIKKGVFTSIKNKQRKELVNQNKPLAGVITREIDEGDPWQYNEECEGGETVAFNRKFPFPTPETADFSHYHQMPSMDKADIIPGPVFAQIISRAKFGTGKRTVEVRIFNKIPWIEVKTTLLNNEECVRYRIHFPTNIKNGVITREIPFGAVKQPEGEFPVQNWLDYSGKNLGLGILNCGIVGQSVVNNVMSLAITRSIWPREDIPGNLEGGKEIGKTYTFNYGLVPHNGNWQKLNMPRLGIEFNRPLLAFKIGYLKKLFLMEQSFLEIQPDNVIASMIRPVENGRAIAIRIYETTGKQATCTIKTDFPVSRIQETDLLERPFKDVQNLKKKLFRFDIGAFEIKTFILRLH